MPCIQKLPNEQISLRKTELEQTYQSYCDMHLSLNMARGKPGPDLICLSEDMLTCLTPADNFDTCDGDDTRNYGLLTGIPEAKALFAQILDVPADNIIIGGNSSLNLMFDYICTAYAKGICGNTPWSRQEHVKFLCPVPGYDRHFAITEYFGIEMISIPMSNDGPDMDLIEKLVQDASVKGVWCVPMYSNPSGITYSDETVKRFAALKPAANDFRIIWDNAYCVHHLYEDNPAKLLNIFKEAQKYGNEDLVVTFTSTSKISFPGAGIACLAASPKNIEDIKKRMTVQTIGFDKINMLRHARYFKDIEGIRDQMVKRGNVLRPKFELVDSILHEELDGKNIATWNKPQGGYFISVNLLPGCAKRTVELLKNAGVSITGAGATFPYKNDPDDSNLRLAPSYPPLNELEISAKLFCICAELAAIEKTLSE